MRRDALTRNHKYVTRTRYVSNVLLGRVLLRNKKVEGMNARNRRRKRSRSGGFAVVGNGWVDLTESRLCSVSFLEIQD